MRSSREERLEVLFDEAVELQVDSRAAFLDEHCAGDSDLRAELERLLARDESAVNDLAAAPFRTLEPHDEVLKAGMMITGRYTLVRRIGAGGMGVVWLAEQADPKRDVALKVIRTGLLSRSMLRRFSLEAAVLGRLQHPGIAQIHEAGTYDDGGGDRPFFAMELVDGLALMRHAAENRLDLGQRLDLFARICDAVQHAHQKGVVHRDLKPGNILVNRDGQPKILDFGVARATNADLQFSTIQTNVGQLIGTVPYMSPEQVTGRTDRLDTRSDVYALGVILYQLLSDRLPYDLDDRNITAAARVIAEDEPTPLTSLSRAFRGDLNTITLKALEKEPELRYQSASDLAADVRRFINVEPILARPASTMDHLRKFARRNKGLVGAVAAAFVLLLAGITGTTLAMFQAQAQRDNAERQSRKAQAVTDFLNEDLLSQANPLIRAGADVKLHDVLNEAAKTIEGRFPDAPDVEAAIRVTLGQAYFDLADYKAAAPHLSRAADLQDQLDDESERLRITQMLGQSLLMDWKADEAEPIVRENLDEIEAHFGAESVQAARAHGLMGVLHKRRAQYVDAEAEYRRALNIFAAAAARAPLDEKDRRAQIINKNNLAITLSDQERFAEQETMLREVIDDWTAFRGRRHPDTAYGMNNLGDALWRQAGPLPDGTWDQARLAEAEALFREALDIRRETLGDNHPNVYFSLYGIGLIESESGQFAQAEQTMRSVLAFRERTLDPLNRDLLVAMGAVGATLEKQGRYAEAVPLFREALRRSYEAGHDFELEDQARFRRKLLQSLRKLGDHESIRAVHAEYHARLEQALESPSADEETRWVRRANSLVTRLLRCEVTELRDPARALAWARRAEERMPDDPDTLNNLAWALAENGLVEKAIATQQRAVSLLPEDFPVDRREAMQDSLNTFRNRLQGKE